jgi:hypothetical protein
MALGIVAVIERTLLLAAVAEAIGEDLMKHLVAPQHRAGKHPAAGREIEFGRLLGSVLLQPGPGERGARLGAKVRSPEPRDDALPRLADPTASCVRCGA